jgi:formate hydrogenlyase subunit 6/NADH:ubiquinone oxidoreductase subunit I
LVNRTENKSVLSAVFSYVYDVWLALRSFGSSCMTAFPYLFGAGDLRKEVTEQYPDPISSKTEDDLPPRTRGLLNNDISRCTGCRECEKVCPTACITVETQPGPEASKAWVSTFDIDFSRCIFCGLCVEVCLPQSLTHTKKYEGAAYHTSEMVARFGRGDVTPEQQEKWASVRRQQESNGETTL